MTEEDTFRDPRNVTELVPSIDIESMCHARAEVLRLLEEASDRLRLADERFSAIGGHSLSRVVGPSASRTGDGHADLVKGEVSDAMKMIDATLWNRLMHESGLLTIMSSQRRDKWRKTIQSLEILEFTPEAIFSTFRKLHDERTKMLREGVVELFRKLSWNHKTNKPQMFGKKLIVQYFSDKYLNDDHHVSLELSATDTIDDLVRVLCVLEGKPEPDHREGVRSKVYAAHREGLREVDLGYFVLRWFKKGTAHVLFANSEHVDSLNHILSAECPDVLPAR